jgi:predicted nuclease of predicted toxin-antitoxin system
VLVKLLLDENISPAVVRALAADGVDAWHVRDRGLEGAADHELLDRAYAEDRILVTSATSRRSSASASCTRVSS